MKFKHLSILLLILSLISLSVGAQTFSWNYLSNKMLKCNKSFGYLEFQDY